MTRKFLDAFHRNQKSASRRCSNYIFILHNSEFQPWWRHQIGKTFRVTGPLWGGSVGHRWILLTKVSDTELWFFLDVHLNKGLSKQTRCRWFETPWPSLRLRCNDVNKNILAGGVCLSCYSDMPQIPALCINWNRNTIWKYHKKTDSAWKQQA